MNLTKFVPEGAVQKMSRSLLTTKKNSPHIFFALGVAGVIGSAFLACRATLKLEDTLDEIREDLDETKAHLNHSAISVHEDVNELQREKSISAVYIRGGLKVVKLYGPSVALGGASIAALAGSHVQLTRRNAALSAALTLMTQTLDEYRERVREEIGEEKEADLFHGTETKEIEVEGVKTKIKEPIRPGLSPYAVWFDEKNTNWKPNAEWNRCFIEGNQRFLNQKLQTCGHLFLNDVYDALGMERSSIGAIVGWISGTKSKGDGYIDFGLYNLPENAELIVGDPRMILLDFNVDGVVYNMIEE